MKILICICTYKRNKSLVECIHSFSKAFLPNNVKISFLILDNSKNFESLKLIKNFKKKFKFNIYCANEKKRGIVNARNKCLKISKSIKPKYMAFIDDDCTVDKNWLINIYKLLNKTNADIITGPQRYKKSNKFTSIFEKKYKKK